MIHIIIDENNPHLLHDIMDTLQTSGYNAILSITTNLESIQLISTVDYSAESNAIIRVVARQSSSNNLFNKALSQSWTLNVLGRELLTPSGKSIFLSSKECSVLSVAVNAKRKIISRRALIEAMGYDYLQYDERCLEGLISRLRRKVVKENFTLRAIKGCGYLFDVNIEKSTD